jgi:hypothetical protein
MRRLIPAHHLPAALRKGRRVPQPASQPAAHLKGPPPASQLTNHLKGLTGLAVLWWL